MQIAGEVLPKSQHDAAARVAAPVRAPSIHHGGTAIAPLVPRPAWAPGGGRTASSRRLPCNPQRRIAMGKYFLAWLLGVPAGLLLLIFLVTHLL
jgi:hypothetical protein